MKNIEFTVSVHIKTSPQTAYEHLANLDNHPGLQPLVVATEALERGQDAQGHQTKRFYSIEQFHFLGFIPYKNKIKVLMTLLPEANTIVQEVDSFPNIYLRSETCFAAADGGTTVTETVIIDCPDLLLGYVRKTAVSAHEVLMQNLKARLEKDLLLKLFETHELIHQTNQLIL